MAMKVRTPAVSNLYAPFASALLSGVPATMSMPSREIAAAAKKIHRHPTFSAMRPPNRAAKPEPPQEPMDQRETARWRAAPSQYAFTRARLADMMNAPDRPWRMRPSVRKAEARLPDGANPTSNEPMMLSTKPTCTIFTRPKRSARLPMTTMKMPENNAVIDTAMFITLVSMPRSSAITGEMFSVVCANSQNARTPKMMPNRTRSFPTKRAPPLTRGDFDDMALSHAGGKEVRVTRGGAVPRADVPPKLAAGHTVV